jgi:DNA polymerase-3 subunit beta
MEEEFDTETIELSIPQQQMTAETSVTELFNIYVDHELFSDAVSNTQKIIDKKQAIPILGNICLEASEDNKLLLVGTDMDVMISLNIAIKTLKPGKITVPANMLNDILRKLPGGELHLIATNKSLSITVGNSHFQLPIIDADQFPYIRFKDPIVKFKMPAKDLYSLLSRTKFAISNEEARYHLNGVNFHIAGSYLKIAATDLHRLATSWIVVPKGAEKMPNIIVPKKTINELIVLLAGKEEEIELEISSSKLLFRFTNGEIISKLIEGIFPEYESVIPSKYNISFRLDAIELGKALERMEIFANEKTKSVTMKISKGNVQLESGINSFSSGLEILALDDFTVLEEGQAIEQEIAEERFVTGFNIKYLLDVVKVIKGDWMKLCFTSSTSAVIVYDELDENSLFLIMPIRV